MDDFVDRPGCITFPSPITQKTVDWWQITFRGETPLEVARRLCRGMPGDVMLKYSKIGSKSGGFTLEVTANQGNVQIWFHSSTLDLRRKDDEAYDFGEDLDSTFSQDDVGVDRAHRGNGLVQMLMTNVAAFALRMHVTRLTLNTHDVGGYMWARAGAVPVGS